MRNLLFALIVGLGLSASVSLPSAQARTVDCENCISAKQGKGLKGTPVNDYVCVYFTQAIRQGVTLALHLKDGTVKHITPKQHGGYDAGGLSGRICPSRALIQASAKMEICGEVFGNAIYNEADTKAVATKAAHSQANTACLKGKELCAKEGFKIQQ